MPGQKKFAVRRSGEIYEVETVYLAQVRHDETLFDTWLEAYKVACGLTGPRELPKTPLDDYWEAAKLVRRQKAGKNK
jgi:hypothetical protein